MNWRKNMYICVKLTIIIINIIQKHMKKYKLSNFRWRLQCPTAIGYDFVDIAFVSLSAENNKHYNSQGFLSIIEIFVGFLLDFGHFYTKKKN